MNPKQVVVIIDRIVDDYYHETGMTGLSHIDCPIHPEMSEDEIFELFEEHQDEIAEYFGNVIKVNIYDTNPAYELFLDKFQNYKVFGGYEEVDPEIDEEVFSFWDELETGLFNYMGLGVRLGEILVEFDNEFDSEIDLD